MGWCRWRVGFKRSDPSFVVQLMDPNVPTPKKSSHATKNRRARELRGGGCGEGGGWAHGSGVFLQKIEVPRTDVQRQAATNSIKRGFVQSKMADFSNTTPELHIRPPASNRSHVIRWSWILPGRGWFLLSFGCPSFVGTWLEGLHNQQHHLFSLDGRAPGAGRHARGRSAAARVQAPWHTLCHCGRRGLAGGRTAGQGGP